MRKLLSIVIFAVSMFTISAQDTFVFPVKFEQEALTIDTIFADNIEVEVLEYGTAFIPDNEQFVIHYMDYEAGEWKYIDYPIQEEARRFQGIIETTDGFRFNAETESWVYSFDTSSWSPYEPPPQETLDPNRFSYTPEPFVCEPTEEKVDWYYDSFRDETYTFCNAETREFVEISADTVKSECALEETRIFHSATFFGTINNGSTKLCTYDFTNSTFVINGIFDKLSDDIDSIHTNDNGDVWIINKVELENGRDYGLSPLINTDILRFKPFQQNSLEHIVGQNPVPTLITQQPSQTAREALLRYGYTPSTQYTWVEHIHDNEEAIYTIDLNIGEPELLFTREHENLGHTFYPTLMTVDAQIIRIQEPIIFRTGLERVDQYFYSRDGHLLHQDTFNSRFPHTEYSVWWTNSTYIMFSTNYNRRERLENYWRTEPPIYFYDFSDDRQVNVSQVVDFAYHSRLETITSDNVTYWILRNFDKLDLYVPDTRVQIPFMSISPRDYCIEIRHLLRKGEVNLVIKANSDCETFSYTVFSALLNISINPSGEDDGG